MHARNIMVVILLALGSYVGLIVPASSESFYEGKTITLITSTGVGGAYDLLGRAVARFMPSYIPGKPTITVQNMPGAGNVLATNYMYNRAPRDGTTIAVIHAAMPLHQVLDGSGVRYDSEKFNWLGSNGSENEAILVWSTAGIRTIEDAKKHEVVFGGTGEGSGIVIIPRAMNHVLGTRFKVVIGYKSSEDVNLAMERGEVQGRAFGFDDILAQHSEWLHDKKINIIAQAGVRHDKHLSDVPLITELATTDEGREIMSLVSSPPALGHPFLAPPGVPAERVALLRQAFLATLKDEDFLREAARLNFDIDPMDAEQVTAIVRRIMNTPADIVAKTKAAVSGKESRRAD